MDLVHDLILLYLNVKNIHITILLINKNFHGKTYRIRIILQALFEAGIKENVATNLFLLTSALCEQHVVIQGILTSEHSWTTATRTAEDTMSDA